MDRRINMKMERSKKRSLLNKSMSWFILCIVLLFILAAPAFYYLTKNYYAEDMEALTDAVETGKVIPQPDLEEDILKGIMIQYLLITALLAAGVVLTMRFVSKRLWLPFYSILDSIENFRLENVTVPNLQPCDIEEFDKLSKALQCLMTKSIDTYQSQKEFTENASHELQTPLAIFQTKLELLLQQPELTSKQAEIIQDLFQMTSRLSHLNRNLLLLAKIDNELFDVKERIRLDKFIDSLLLSFETISGKHSFERHYCSEPLYIIANNSLLESMITNLVINAIRHSSPGGIINIGITDNSLSVVNISDEPALSPSRIFNRFYNSSKDSSSNGLGLAIVKAICDYHGWKVGYHFKKGSHCFTVKF